MQTPSRPRPRRSTGVSYYEDARSYTTRRKQSLATAATRGLPHPSASQLAVDAAAAVKDERFPLSPEVKARFKADRMWHLREFGSHAPAGRADALQLRAWLTEKCVPDAPA